jgi:release factor glutamine methyltransferase
VNRTEPERVEGASAGTVGEVLRGAAATLAAAGIDSAGLDARLLVGAALGLDQVGLLQAHRRALTSAERLAVGAVIDRRLAREPVSRILGRRWFWGLEFEIGPATLDPRPETETLVAGVLHRLREQSWHEWPLRIADLGTGSGAILVALLSELPNATGTAIDIDDATLALARRNAIRHGVEKRIELKKSDWFGAISMARFDVIVANPPYIPTCDLDCLAPEVGGFDPKGALDGGADGLAAYRAIIGRAATFMVKDGLLVLEVGAGQANAVGELMAETGELWPEEPASLWHDLSGHVRCVAARARSSVRPKKGLDSENNRYSVQPSSSAGNIVGQSEGVAEPCESEQLGVSDQQRSTEPVSR